MVFKSLIPAVKFEITLGEGPIKYTGQTHTVTSWYNADNVLRQLANCLNPNGGYYKTDFNITFLDGGEYTGTYYLKYEGPFNLREHICNFLELEINEANNHVLAKRATDFLNTYSVSVPEVTYIIRVPFDGYVVTEAVDGYCPYSGWETAEHKLNSDQDLRQVSGEFLDVILSRYHHDKYLIDPAKEITEERYFDMLEVLPPENWCTANGVEQFRMCEYETGNITIQFAKHDNRYLEKYIDAKNPSTWISIDDFKQLAQ